MIFDIGWRGVMVALVVLADLIVFADLARAEFGDLRAKHAPRRRAASAALGKRRAPGMAEHSPS